MRACRITPCGWRAAASCTGVDGLTDAARSASAPGLFAATDEAGFWRGPTAASIKASGAIAKRGRMVERRSRTATDQGRDQCRHRLGGRIPRRAGHPLKRGSDSRGQPATSRCRDPVTPLRRGGRPTAATGGTACPGSCARWRATGPRRRLPATGPPSVHQVRHSQDADGAGGPRLPVRPVGEHRSASPGRRQSVDHERSRIGQSEQVSGHDQGPAPAVGFAPHHDHR
jgi:hypothetical protein